MKDERTNNSYDPAFPQPEPEGTVWADDYHPQGLTKREYFAGLAMQSQLISGMNAAKGAVDCADELLKALDDTK